MENVFDKADFADEYVKGGFDVANTRFKYLPDLKILKPLLDIYKTPTRGEEVATPASFLDVGCATANMHPIIKDWHEGVFYCGTDFSFQMLRKANDIESPPPLVNAKLPSLPFKSSSFDFVICLAVMLYSDDYEAWLLELLRVSSRFVLIDVFVNQTDEAITTTYRSMFGDDMNVLLPGMKYFVDLMPNIQMYFKVDEPFCAHIQPYSPRLCGFPDYPEYLKLYKITLLYEQRP